MRPITANQLERIGKAALRLEKIADSWDEQEGGFQELAHKADELFAQVTEEALSIQKVMGIGHFTSRDTSSAERTTRER